MMNRLSTNVQLGKRIEYLRRLRNWSQEDLSLESRVNKNYICDLENGRRNPSLMILSRLARALRISLQTLFQGIEWNYLINKTIFFGFFTRHKVIAIGIFRDFFNALSCVFCKHSV